MTQEDRQLLLKDLCARLTYGVKVRGIFLNYNKDKDKILYEECDKELNYKDLNRYESLKPYLRTMSSMTEEERKEYTSFVFEQPFLQKDKVANLGSVHMCIDWLNAHHFDYRELIEKGLAIEVTEKHNPYKE